MSTWTTSRRVFGLLLLGALAAGVFVPAWGVMPAISMPAFLEPIRAEQPSIIIWWTYVLYVWTVFLTLIPAALFWLVADGNRLIVSALLAVTPLLVLLLADFAYAALTFDFALRYGRLLWDATLMVVAATLLFLVSNVLRRLTKRWSGP